MKRMLLVAALLIGAGASQGDAKTFDWFDGRLSVGGGYGFAKPKLPYSFQNSHEEGRMWTAHLKYFLTDDFSVVASYADMYVNERTADRQIQFRPIIGSLRYNFFKGLPISPYITAGAGVSRNRREVAGAPNIEWTKLAWQGGLGFEFFINQNTSLGAEALYHHIYPDAGARVYRPISAVGTVNIYFGDGPKTKRARQEADEAKRRADQSDANARSSQEQALTAQQQALTAQQGQQAAMGEADAARKAAEAAAAAQAAANQQSQAMQQKMQQAQAQLDAIKQMVARKELKPVNFKTGSAELLAESSAALDKVAEITKQYPDLRLRVEGHTDSQGDDASNQQLSQRRADSVMSYLTGKSGVPAEQITSVGFGESQPVGSNDSAEGRAKNRRVEFIYVLK